MYKAGYMVNTRKRALVVGGGIGGLSAALALRQAGMDVQVFEAAREMRALGAGITLWSNAVSALEQLGLADALQAIGMPATYRMVSTWRGEVLSKIPVDQLAHGRGAAMLICHRPELQSALLHAVGEEHVTLNARCVRYVQNEKEVCAQLEDGREIEGDLLVAADGIHSILRAQLFGARPLRYAGYTAWRGVASLEEKQFPTGVSSQSWGQGRLFGLIPLTQGRMYWFASLTMREGENKEETGAQSKQRMRDLFQGWHSPIEATIEAADPSTISRAGIYETRPLRHWSIGRVTLLGDAAHAMTPNMGQGACQAIEDAVVLGRCLREEHDISTALRHYEMRRSKRVQRVALLSRRIGWLAQLEHLCEVRNTLMKQWYTGWLTKELDWLLGYEV